MLKNLKCEYFIKLFFSLISEEWKLKLIKYNKNLQNKLEIKLLNYMIYSERYIKYESIGKGKEYNAHDRNLIFEGEYINGQRNGNGKEYKISDDEGSYELIFEGKYLKGKRNGKGKEYNVEGKLIYEGEYLNDIKWNGKCKEYNNDGRLIFEGEYLYGKRWNGKIKDYYCDREILEGDCINGNIIGEMYKNNIQLTIDRTIFTYINGYIKEYNCDGGLQYEGK